MEFKDKIILITGAGSGIGRVTAHAFAKEGGTVIVADINEKGGAETVQQIEALGGKAMFIKNNVADYEDVVKMHQTIIDKYGQLDVAINNCLLYTSPSPRDATLSRLPSSA